jgi:hypothetical protein
LVDALFHLALDENLKVFDLAGIQPQSVLLALIDLYGAVLGVSLSRHHHAAHGAMGRVALCSLSVGISVRTLRTTNRVRFPLTEPVLHGSDDPIKLTSRQPVTPACSAEVYLLALVLCFRQKQTTSGTVHIGCSKEFASCRRA